MVKADAIFFSSLAPNVVNLSECVRRMCLPFAPTTASEGVCREMGSGLLSPALPAQRTRAPSSRLPTPLRTLTTHPNGVAHVRVVLG